MSARVYPLAWFGGDSRFTHGLIIDVAKVLEAAGYPAIRGVDFVDLMTALHRFAYSSDETPAGVVTAAKDAFAELDAHLLDEDQPHAARGHGQDDAHADIRAELDAEAIGAHLLELGVYEDDDEEDDR